jgi:hypothetical protein
VTIIDLERISSFRGVNQGSYDTTFLILLSFDAAKIAVVAPKPCPIIVSLFISIDTSVVGLARLFCVRI